MEMNNLQKAMLPSICAHCEKYLDMDCYKYTQNRHDENGYWVTDDCSGYVKIKAPPRAAEDR